MGTHWNNPDTSPAARVGASCLTQHHALCILVWSHQGPAQHCFKIQLWEIKESVSVPSRKGKKHHSMQMKISNKKAFLPLWSWTEGITQLDHIPAQDALSPPPQAPQVSHSTQTPTPSTGLCKIHLRLHHVTKVHVFKLHTPQILSLRIGDSFYQLKSEWFAKAMWFSYT